MNVVRPYSALMIDGLSYADWEDDADRLRQLALGNGRLTKRHLARTEKLISSIDAEIESIDGVTHVLTGFDAVRVGCVRDLLAAFRFSLVETRRLIEARLAKRVTRARKPQKATA